MDLEGKRRTSKGVLSRRIEPGASPQLVFDCRRLLFTKRTQWVCGDVEEIGVGFQQRGVTGEFACGGSVSVLRMRDPADAYELGL